MDIRGPQEFVLNMIRKVAKSFQEHYTLFNTDNIFSVFIFLIISLSGKTIILGIIQFPKIINTLILT